MGLGNQPLLTNYLVYYCSTLSSTQKGQVCCCKNSQATNSSVVLIIPLILALHPWVSDNSHHEWSSWCCFWWWDRAHCIYILVCVPQNLLPQLQESFRFVAWGLLLLIWKKLQLFPANNLCLLIKKRDTDIKFWMTPKDVIKLDHTPQTKLEVPLSFSEQTIQKPPWRYKTQSVVPLAKKKHGHLNFNTHILTRVKNASSTHAS